MTTRTPLLEVHEFFRGGPASAEGWSQLMADTPVSHQLHAAIPWLLYAVWPLSRLVHVWSYPLEYLGRPYILYRRRAAPARS